MLLRGCLMQGVTPKMKNAAVHLWMKGLYSTSHHFGKSGVAAYFLNLNAKIPQCACCSSG